MTTHELPPPGLVLDRLPSRRRRLALLFVAALVIALGFTGGYVWLTLEPYRAVTTFSRDASVPGEQFSGQAGALIPTDRGEPRTERLESLERVAAVLRQERAESGPLAEALLAAGETCFELERYAAAQERVTEVLRLVPDQAAWQHIDARLLQAALRHTESASAEERDWCRTGHVARQQALRLKARGQFLEAIRSAGESVTAQRRLLAAEAGQATGVAAPAWIRNYHRAALADQLLLLGELALEHSDTYAQAPSYLREARELIEQTRGRNHPRLAEVLTAQAIVADERGDYATAEALYEQALDLHRRTRGELSLAYAATLARQGRMQLEWWDDYAVGKGYRALQIREQLLGKDALECAESLEYLGMHALWLLQFEKSEELLQRALRIRQQHQGANHPDAAEAMNWLSQVHIEQGDVAEAHVLVRQAITLTEQHRGAHHPRIVRYLANVAALGVQDWNQPRGERECRRGLDIAKRMGTERHPAALAAEVALAYLAMDEESEYGLGNLRRIAPQFIASLLRDTIARHEAVPRSTQLPSYPSALVHLAHCGYWDDFRCVSRDEAKDLLDRAGQNIAQHGWDQHTVYPEYLRVRGRWHMWASEYELALRYLSEHRDWVERQFGTVLTERRAGAWRALSGCYLHRGQRSAEMAACLRHTADLDEQIFRRNAAGQCETDRHAMGRARYYSLGTCLLNPAAELAAGEAYRQVLLAKGSISELQLQERAVRERAMAQPAWRPLEEARLQLKRVAFDMPQDPKEQATWRGTLFEQADRKEIWERELAVATRSFVPAAASLEPAAVQAALPQNAVLLDFVEYLELAPPDGGRGRLKRTRHLGVFAVRADREPEFVRIGPCAELLEAVFAWRECLHSADTDPATMRRLADRVTEMLWQPLVTHLQDARLVLIAPDGPACFVPFAALSGRTPGTYLLEEWTIGYVPSARHWVDLQANEAGPLSEGLLAIGDIDYGAEGQPIRPGNALAVRGLLPGDTDWDNLPATAVEIEQVSVTHREAFGPQVPAVRLTGKSAAVDMVLDALSRRPRFIHFAGHGFFANSLTANQGAELSTASVEHARLFTDDEAIVFARAPLLLSGLVLAKSTSRREAGDELLTAEELASLDLRGTEMAVLSACETALGNLLGGEGALGLQRAFLTAGARSTVTSLWKVDDSATGKLMEAFYRHLWSERLSKWEALRQAQLDILNGPELVASQEQLLVSRGLLTGRTRQVGDRVPSPQSSHPRVHPARWGAFVFYGDGR